MLQLHRELIALRRRRPALTLGSFSLLECKGDLLVYERRKDDDRLAVVLNLGQQPQSVDLPAWLADANVLLSTDPGRAPGPSASPLHVEANEGIVLAGS